MTHVAPARRCTGLASAADLKASEPGHQNELVDTSGVVEFDHETPSIPS